MNFIELLPLHRRRPGMLEISKILINPERINSIIVMDGNTVIQCVGESHVVKESVDEVLRLIHNPKPRL